MNIKHFARRMTIKVNGEDTVIPIVDNVPDNQRMFIDLIQQGKSLDEAYAFVQDIWQTRYYEDFKVINRHDGVFIKVPIYSPDPDIQARYDHLRYLGESHNMADMVITKKSAGTGLTDSTLLKYDLMHNQFTAKQQGERGDALAADAKAAGISITGKFYHHGIAAKYGDKEAWVGSVDDIKDVCKRRGWDFKIVDGNMRIGVKADMTKTLEQQFCNQPAKV